MLWGTASVRLLIPPVRAGLLTRSPMCAGAASSPCRSAACRLVKAICLIPAIRVVPCSCVRRRHRFCSTRPGHRVLGADGHDGRQPFAWLYGQSGGFSINLGKTGMGTARKDDKQVNGAFITFTGTSTR